MRGAPQLGLSLRQQLAVLRRHHRRPSFGNFDRLFWVVARCLWSGWRQWLILVAPETVVRWHRAGFRLYWKLVSKARGPIGRRPASQEVRDLIFRMVTTLSGRKSSAITDRHVSTCHRHGEPHHHWITKPRKRSLNVGGLERTKNKSRRFNLCLHLS
jgi:hypothetical protein